MIGSRSKSGGWLPTLKVPAWIFGVTTLSLVLGGVAAVMWSDLIGLSHSPLCGPSCLDPPIQRALLAKEDEAFKYYRNARSSARRQLDYSPFDTAAWLRIVLLEVQVGGGRLTPSAEDALRQSYRRAPVDAAVAEWRIPLTFEFWGQVSPDVRKAAVDEVTVLFHAPQNRTRLRAFTRQIRSSEGGFAYWMLIQSLADEEDLAGGRETPMPTPRAKPQKAAIAGS